MIRSVIAVIPDAQGMEYVASALAIIVQIMNCRHVISIKIQNGPITVQ